MATSGRHVSTRQAAFIGVGAMVGAGIFSLLGAAGEVAGAAVWLSFLLAGGIATLQGYSFAKLGAKFPSAGGLLEYVNQGFGMGHIAAVTAWLTYFANAIVTAMVAVSFGSYAASVVADGDARAEKAFAVVLVIAMTGLNVAGSTLVARVQSLIVFVVVGILAGFAVATIANIDPSLLSPSTYPGPRDIISSVALTFFAFLGFGVVTFTASDLADPVPPAAESDGDRHRPRDRHLCRGLARRLRHADGPRGHRGRSDGDRGRCPAGARRPGLRPDDGHGAVRDRRRHERRPLSRDRPVRPPRVHGPVPAGHGSAGRRAGIGGPAAGGRDHRPDGRRVRSRRRSPRSAARWR